MRLGRLVEEQRPGVVGRIRDRRLDDARTELLEPLDVRLGGAILARGRPADRRRPRQQPDRQPVEPRRGIGRRRAPTTSSPRRRRSSPSARPCRTLGQSGKTPSTGIRPQLGFSPTTPQHEAGRRTEQPVSVPSPSSQSPAASAAALPPDEPPVVRPGRRGFWTVPYHGFWLVTPQANSCRFALPTTTAPAATSRSTAVAVRVGHVVGVDLRAVGRADARGVDQILDEQAPAVQRPRPRRRRARPR